MGVSRHERLNDGDGLIPFIIDAEEELKVGISLQEARLEVFVEVIVQAA